VAPVPIYAITPSRRLPAKTRLFLDCMVAHLTPAEPAAGAGENTFPRRAADSARPRR
jgi:hypothetical protein